MKMLWYFACLLPLFLFRTNGKKGHLDLNGFRHCYGNFFRKWHSASYLIIAMFKVLSQKIRGKLPIAFWHFFVLRTWINMRAKSFIKTSVNTTETRIDEGTQSVRLEEHCTRIEFMFHLFYAFLFLTNLVFKFNMVLIASFFF